MNIISSVKQFAKVYLIGAGPGAADLITVRGARLLARADAVLYDALVTEEMLELCPQAVKINVGKRCAQKSASQLFINRLLVNTARKHPVVVRLKGGDPMLFGRADEELRALDAAGIPYEVVPGITAALAAASAVAVPLTQRGVARSVAFFTSSTSPDSPQQATLPDCDTLVQYMGGREAALTAERLLAQGRNLDMPVVIVENCSRADQRIRHITLRALQDGLPDAGGPVLVMMGEALALREGQASRLTRAGFSSLDQQEPLPQKAHTA